MDERNGFANERTSLIHYCLLCGQKIKAHYVAARHTQWPKKLSHCHESSLNRIKFAIIARRFINVDYNMSTQI